MLKCMFDNKLLELLISTKVFKYAPVYARALSG
jgi:hypothetical protein